MKNPLKKAHEGKPIITSANLPPQNIDMEQQVLSRILHDTESIYEILDILVPEDFYSRANQLIYSAIIDLLSKNQPIDDVTVIVSLSDSGKLEAVGGAHYIRKVLKETPISTNLKGDAKKVHDQAVFRNLIGSCNRIIRQCFENEGGVDDIIGFAESVIVDFSTRKPKPSFQHIKNVLLTNFSDLEERQKNNNKLTGVTTGFYELDKMLAGLQRSDLILIAARPSMGKTSFAMNIARNAALDNNVVAVFSLEMSKEQLSLRMLCSEGQVDSSRLRSGRFSRDDWNRLNTAAGTLHSLPLFIDDTGNVTCHEIRSKARRLKVEKHGLGLIIIDYLQLMKSHITSDRRDLEVSEISRTLKNMAKELDCPIVALSQLNRRLEERSDKRPQLSDLRESGSLEQDADVVMFIYRDEVYNPNSEKTNFAEVIVAKQRNGPIGTVELGFAKTFTLFTNTATGNYFTG